MKKSFSYRKYRVIQFITGELSGKYLVGLVKGKLLVTIYREDALRLNFHSLTTMKERLQKDKVKALFITHLPFPNSKQH